MTIAAAEDGALGTDDTAVIASSAPARLLRLASKARVSRRPDDARPRVASFKLGKEAPSVGITR